MPATRAPTIDLARSLGVTHKPPRYFSSYIAQQCITTLTMQERAHSDECAISSTRKRCRECRNKYKNDSKKRCAKSKADQIIVTRNVTSKKRSKFHDLLCDNCKSKTTRDFCIECKRIYTCSTSKKHRDLIKSRQSIGQSDQTEQPNVINSDQQKQSNKPVANDSFIIKNDERINSANKRKSTHHDILCNDCKSKMHVPLYVIFDLILGSNPNICLELVIYIYIYIYMYMYLF